MSEFGLDEELEFGMEENKEPAKIAVVEKPKRRPYYVWEVGGEAYKLKLGTAVICQLEGKFKRNLLNIVSGDGIPPLSVMLTIIQGALIQYQRGMKYTKIQQIYDVYLNEGGDQVSLFTDVIMGIMTVSGFFTENQAEGLEAKMEMADLMQ